LHDAGNLTAVGGSATIPAGPSGPGNPLAPTLVGRAGGLQFNLIWDPSVAYAPSDFEKGVIAAARHYTRLYSNDEVLNIAVGYGEINGQSMSSDALGESESYGYETSYNTVASALRADASSSPYQASADASLTPFNPTGRGQFFVTSAEAKTLGLASGFSTTIDGYIGLSSAYPMDYEANVPGNHIGAQQYDAVGTAAHEISEVMGRVGSVGYVMGRGVYAPLDLFRYSTNGGRDVAASTGYFSVDNGATNLGVYNDPRIGADAGDWAEGVIGDSYGEGYPGLRSPVSHTDIIENAVLGYDMTPRALSATSTTGLL
jgi:hypothetical protein